MKQDVEVDYNDEFEMWNFKSFIEYIKEHFIQILLFILVFVIIYIVDYIANINAMIFAMPSPIPGAQQTSNGQTKPEIKTPMKHSRKRKISKK
jgi:hypothetical protein